MDTVSSKPKTRKAKIQWKSDPAIMQAFPFPHTLIYCISKNPRSPKAYNKLIQCCKYFFERNPILVADQICGKTRICLKQKHYDDSYNSKCCIEVDPRKISSRIWYINSLNIYSDFIPDFTTLVLCDKLYQCEIVNVYLCNTVIPFENFEILVQSVENLILGWNLKMFYPDGNPVLLDAILAVCPKIQYFQHECFCSTNISMLTASTLKDISKLENLSNLKEFKLFYIPEIFDIQDVSNFLTKKLINTTVKLHFSAGISAEYKVQLNAVHEKICEEKIQNHGISF